MAKKIEIELPCALSDDEVRSRGDYLVELIARMDAVSEEKSNVARRYKDQLSGLAETQRKVAAAIRTRCETRMVRCWVTYHAPCEGVKRTTRMDTGDVVSEEPMTDAEKQLNLFASIKDLEALAGIEPPEPPSADGDDDEAQDAEQ
jgi:hypothetical protein